MKLLSSRYLFAALGAACLSFAACSDDENDTFDGGVTLNDAGEIVDSGVFPDASVADAGALENPGPAANLDCDSSGENAFTTYGTTAFVTVNEAIFTNVLAEIEANGQENLGNSFASVSDFATFKGNLAAFLVWVYGGPDEITYTDGETYEGPQDMQAAHEGLNITSDQYDYFVSEIVVPALTDNGVSDEDVDTCFAPPLVDTAFKASIVGQ